VKPRQPMMVETTGSDVAERYHKHLSPKNIFFKYHVIYNKIQRQVWQLSSWQQYPNTAIAYCILCSSHLARRESSPS